jgi:CheY-like chemotaxis protein
MTNQKAVLVVDDSSIIRERLKELFSGLKNPATFTYSGSYRAGLQVVHDSSPDVVLLDINLPDKSGIDLLREIKGTHPGTVVIILTNQASNYYKKKCKSLGADFFVDKSNEFEHITGILNSLP